MIVYRKAPQLRVRRCSFPQPPFWFATAVAPYSSRRAAPLAIDYLDGRATASDRLEVAVCDSVCDELERLPRLREPVLIDAAELAEEVFRRGEEALRYFGETSTAAMHLISTLGPVPKAPVPNAVLAIATWPPDLLRLEASFAAAADAGWRWGAAIPVMYPATTGLAALSRIVDAAARHGASFAGSIAIDIDPTAKQALTTLLAIDAGDESYATLFHADLEPLHIATERHIAALADAANIADFVVPPRWEEKSNWNASALLTLTATRMIGMAREPELAGMLARSAHAVANLDKPLARIAASASLSIVEALDAVSADILTEWLETGRASFVEKINRDWRLRRDAGI